MIYEFLTGDLPVSEIIPTSAAVLNLHKSEFFLTDAIENAAEQGKQKKVIIVLVRNKGHFCLHFTYYCQDGLDIPNEEEFVQRFTNSLKTKALISDETVNPYQMFLISGGTRKLVKLEAAGVKEERYDIQR